MKNKKGFTLVELIVAIALVISITVIAIISINSISKKNKEQAYELVKEQIENAAEEYFNNNEYLFEDLTEEAEGYISVGRLVEEGLLNTVTNPITGKKISECTLVKVTKENGIFKLEYKEEEDKTNCDNNKYIVVVNPEPENYETPTIIVKPDGTRGNNDWYKSISDVKITVTIDKKLNDFSVKRIHNSNETVLINFNNYVGSDKEYYLNDGKYENVQYIVTDSKGASISTYLSLKKDGTKPIGKFEIDSKKILYNTNSVNFEIYASDNLSGLQKVKYNDTSYTNFKNNTSNNSYQKELKISNVSITNKLDGKNYTNKIYIYDEAGNYTELIKDYKVYKECDNTYKYTDFTVNEGNCSATCGIGTKKVVEKKYHKDFYTQARCSDSFDETSTELCYGSCQSTTTQKPNTTQKTTENVCQDFNNITINNINKYISVNVAVTNLNSSNKTISKYNTTIGNTKAKFTFSSNNSKITIDSDVSGAFCLKYNNCDYTKNHAGWNSIETNNTITKDVYCDSMYDCYNGYEATVACTKISCGNVVKKVCYRKKLSDTGDKGSFSLVENLN